MSDASESNQKYREISEQSPGKVLYLIFYLDEITFNLEKRVYILEKAKATL